MTQDECLNILQLGHNTFVTGAAGTGKTYILNKYIDYLKENKIKVAITASTGIAATHMNGVTIHSWSGLGIKEEIDDNFIKYLKQKIYLKNRLLKPKSL